MPWLIQSPSDTTATGSKFVCDNCLPHFRQSGTGVAVDQSCTESHELPRPPGQVPGQSGYWRKKMCATAPKHGRRDSASRARWASACVFFTSINIIYPFGSAHHCWSLEGGVHARIHERTYRETGDRANAVLASIKLHAAYNRVAVVYVLIVGIVVGLIGSYWFPRPASGRVLSIRMALWF